MYYCPRCKTAYIKSYFESKQCDACRGDCKTILVPYSGYTLAAWVALTVAMIFFLFYRDVSIIWRAGIFIGVVVFSIGMASIGVGIMKNKAVEIGIVKWKRKSGKNRKNDEDIKHSQP